MNKKRTEKERAREMLLKYLAPGSIVYTVLRKVSASGMTRRIDLYAIRENRPVWLSGYASTLLDSKLPNDGRGLRVSGCGMDMGYHLVNNLSIALFCPDGKYTHDGAYALKHEWI